MAKKFYRIKRYVISTSSVILVMIIFLISLAFFCILNITEIGDKFISNEFVKQIVLNSLLVVTSITGTNILTAIIVEKNNKNQDWRNIISQDILSNQTFYNYMDYETRNDILSAVNCSINGYNNPIQNEIMSSVLNKLDFNNIDFYFEKCNYDVDCKIMDEYIEYHVTRVTDMYSYKNKYTCKKFRVALAAGLWDNELGNMDIKIKLNGVLLSENDYIVETESSVKEVDIERNKYNDIKYVYLKQPLDLYSDDGSHTATTIVYEYIVKASLSDLVNVYRASRPCKHFSVRFTLHTHENYKLQSHTFGFLDSSKAEEDTDNDFISYNEFRDWIFEDDGVVITIVPR